MSGPRVPLRPRPSRAVPAVICALVLLAAGAALVWAAVVRLAQGQWPQFVTTVSDWLVSLRWNSPEAWAAGSILVVLGIVLLLTVVIPGRYASLNLQIAPGREVSGESRAVISRRAVARLAAATCEHIDGVSSASATATDREVRVAVETALRETVDVQHWAADGVRSRLEASGLDPIPNVSVSIRSTH